jgi:adenylate cyclase
MALTKSQFLREALLHPGWVRSAAVALAALLGGLFVSLAPGLLDSLDERADVLTWRMSDEQREERRVVVVDIDERSIQALGPWPWSRETLARLVQGLDHYNVGLKLFDIVLPDAKRGDDQLLKAFEVGAPNVWGQVFSLTPDIRVTSGQPYGGLDLGPCPSIAATGFGYVANQAGLMGGNATSGHITPIIDADGSVRRVPAFVCWQGRSYPSLVLAGLLAADGGTPQVVRGQSWFEAPWRVSLGRLPYVSLPLNDQGQVRVSYQVPRAGFVSVSAVDVIERRAPAEMLQGVWALVGSTAFGVGDAVPTPHGGAVGGLEVHAQLLAAALDGRTPYAPIAAWAWPFLSGFMGLTLLLALTVLGGKAAPGGRVRRLLGLFLPLMGLFLAAVYFVAHALALLYLHLWLGWAAQSLVVVMAAVLLSGGELARLRWEKTRLFDNLSSYLSVPVAREVGLSELSGVVEAARRDVVVLCASLRNFGTFADAQSPEVAAQVLHEFVSEVNRVVQSHGGVLQHVHGADALAVWSAHGDLSVNSSVQAAALAAAHELWRGCESLCRGWQPDADLSDEAAPLELGVGIESGCALVGSVGPSQRRVRTLLGEPVHVAQALQQMTAELSYPILIGPLLQVQLEQHSHELTRLGEFLLPGTTSTRVLHAVVVDFNATRLRLIIGQGDQQRLA